MVTLLYSGFKNRSRVREFMARFFDKMRHRASRRLAGSSPKSSTSSMLFAILCERSARASQSIHKQRHT